ncbi:MAG: Pycsar system effector family protein [Calditrichia bacterium]
MKKKSGKSDNSQEKVLATAFRADQEEVKKLKKKLSKYEGMPEKGIETWFRVTSRNLYTRRQIVDTKSNILVTVNSIIISVILGSLYSRLDTDPHLLWAIGPMILTNLISMAYAIFATRPTVEKGAFTKEQVEQGQARLMTFDDFYKMSESDYEWAVDRMMQKREFLYSTIKKDIHHLGLDLSRRYKYIRTAYDVFLAGLVFSVFMFGLCHIMFSAG